MLTIRGTEGGGDGVVCERILENDIRTLIAGRDLDSSRCTNREAYAGTPPVIVG